MGDVSLGVLRQPNNREQVLRRLSTARSQSNSIRQCFAKRAAGILCAPL
jgi:hypothetical protein